MALVRDKFQTILNGEPTNDLTDAETTQLNTLITGKTADEAAKIKEEFEEKVRLKRNETNNLNAKYKLKILHICLKVKRITLRAELYQQHLACLRDDKPLRGYFFRGVGSWGLAGKIGVNKIS